MEIVHSRYDIFNMSRADRIDTYVFKIYVNGSSEVDKIKLTDYIPNNTSIFKYDDGDIYDEAIRGSFDFGKIDNDIAKLLGIMGVANSYGLMFSDEYVYKLFRFMIKHNSYLFIKYPNDLISRINLAIRMLGYIEYTIHIFIHKYCDH